jgi:hypothetical protein
MNRKWKGSDELELERLLELELELIRLIGIGLNYIQITRIGIGMNYMNCNSNCYEKDELELA